MILIFDLRPLLHKKVSGVEVFVNNIVEELVKISPKNWQIVFWVNASKKFEFAEFKEKGICVQTFFPNRLFNLTASLLRWPKIDQLVLKALGKEKEEKTILFVPDPRPSPVSKYCKKIFTFHDLSPLHFTDTFNIKTRFFHKLLRLEKEIQESEHLVAVSEFTKQDILSSFFKENSLKKKKISVIHEAAENGYFDKSLQAKKPKEYIPEKFFLCLSTLEPRKNIPRVLEAFQSISQKYPDTKLLLVGKKNDDIFSQLQLQIGKDVFHIDRFLSLQEKKWLYQNAHALVYPSLFEGFGLPILEAMSQGCPVIYGNNSSQNEVAGDAGIAVNADSMPEIAQAMEKLLTMEPSLYEELKQKSFERVKAFSWGKAAKELISVIKST